MRSIWAVALNTVKQALRLRIAVAFIILLAVLLPVMGTIMTGDGTLKGKLQTFTCYGLSLTAFLLCLLTVIVSIYSLTSDIAQRQIFTVLTKPVRRVELLLGKMLGVVLLDAALLALFSAVIYVIIIYIPGFSKAGEAELAQAGNEFYTARAGLTPVEPDVTKEVLETYNRLLRSGQVPQDVADDIAKRKKYVKTLTEQIKVSKRAAGAGQDLVLEFRNVKPLDPNQSLFIRFKYEVSYNPPDLQVYGRWFVGDDRQLKYGTEIRTPMYTFDRKDIVRTFHEIEVPAKAVAEDGYLAVAFLNVSRFNNAVVIFPAKDGLEVLYKADTFTANYIRAVFLILFNLVFLACLGILASTFLSFNVAMLLCLAVFFTGTISGFCLESFDFLSANITSIYSFTVKPLVQLLPQFDEFSPTKFLVPARLIGWSFLARAVCLMVCVKSVLLMVIASVIFKFREIAKVII